MNNPPGIEKRMQDAEFVSSFMQSMHIITRQTGVNFVIDTQRDGIAWMIPGKTEVYFNPTYTLAYIQAVADKLREENGLETNFQLNQSHLSAIVLHEINHMINHTQLKNSPMTMSIDGTTMNMLQYQQHIYQKYGSEFQHFENILEDIDVNHDATRRQAPVFEHAKQDIYRYISAPSADFSQQSLAEQFARTCLRESMINELCIIDESIRGCVDYLSGAGGMLQTLRNPTISYDEQFPFIVKLYEDYYLPLKQKDKEEKQKEKENGGKSEQQGSGEPNNGDKGANNHPTSTPEEEKRDEETNKVQSPSAKDEEQRKQGDDSDELDGGGDGKEKEQEGEGENTNNKSSDEKNEGEANNQSNNATKQGDNNQSKSKTTKPTLLPHIFDNLDENGKPREQPHTNDSLDKTQQQLTDALAHADSEKKKDQPSLSDQIQQAVEQAIERKIKADNKTPEDRTLEDQIKRERGLDPEDDKNTNKIDTLKKKINQRKKEIEPKLKNLTDRHGEKVYDRIVNEILSKIVQIRKTPTIKDRSPRRFSEGGQFDPQSLVSGIIDMKAGNTDPSIMRNEFHKEKEQRTIGAFTITLIGDGSGSMKGQKNTDQKLNFLLILSALHQLNEQLKDEGIDEELTIQTCAMMFLGSHKVKTIKKRGSDLSLKDIIEANDALDYKDGSDTNGYDAIKQYYDQICKPLPGQTTEEHAERLETIKDGKSKEIVIIMSDGGFNNGDDTKTQTLTKKLRDIGIIVCGIGITKDGSPMIDIFGAKHEDDPAANAGGFGLVCEHTADLGTTLNSLLLEHLEDTRIIGA